MDRDRFSAVENRLKSRIRAHRLAWGLVPLALGMTLLTLSIEGARLSSAVAELHGQDALACSAITIPRC